MDAITLLYFDGCPNWITARERLAEALKQTGRVGVLVQCRRVETPEEAQALGFRGSPTILVGDTDPFGGDDLPVALACRVYDTPHGLDGAPTVEQLLEVLRSEGR